MVFQTNETFNIGTDLSTSRTENAKSPVKSCRTSSAVQKTDSISLFCVGEYLTSSGISEKSKELIIGSWRKGTKKQYRIYLEKWKERCSITGFNPISPSLNIAIDFLADLADVNTARSALSSIICMPDGTNFGKHTLVKRLLKGNFEKKKPSLPRYAREHCIKIFKADFK